MESGQPKVGIVVLNWNNYRASSRCIKSLQITSYKNYQIYFVDNGSNDGSEENLNIENRENPRITFIVNAENLGFAAGCNPGINRAIQEGCEYVLLLNNDCVVFDPHFLTRGIELGEESPKCGIIGGKILCYPETNRIWSTGGFISFWGAEHHIGHQEIDQGQYDLTEHRQFISGALMLIKRRVIETIGPLPDVYFFGKEEWEYSTQAIRHGYSLMYHSKFQIYHEASNSHDKLDPTYIYNGTLSKILYKKRNHAFLAYLVWWTSFKFYVHFLFSLKYRLQRTKYVKGVSARVIHDAMLRAIQDADNLKKITGSQLQRFRQEIAKSQS